MADRLAFNLFGDQSLDTHAFLANFIRRGDQGVLAKAFLDQVGRALWREVESLPALERQRLPVFRTLQQLNESYHSHHPKHPGIDGALVCITQLAHYIDHASKHHEDTNNRHTINVGLCSGLFAATAVASSQCVSTLVPLAVQIVLISFRAGTYVQSIAERLSPTTSDSSESWTHIYPSVKEVQASTALAAFHDAHGYPPATRAYISATSAGSIAISGPPATLKALSSGGYFASQPTPIPVYGPYHAPHLHHGADVAKILRLDDPEVLDAFYGTKPRLAVMSATSGSLFQETDTVSLLKAVVAEILNETLMFHNILSGCSSIVRDFKGTDCLILPLGPTQNANTLANLIKSQSDLTVTVRKPSAIHPLATASNIGNHGSSGRAKLAIVGMAGRFPDAASIEALWDLLSKGLDVHREVPPDRFNVKTHYDPTGKAINTSHTPYGCWIKNPGFFDPRFFNMSPREAFQTDPMQRMALTTAYEALEMSGYVPNRTPSTRLDRIGTFYGQTSDDWREINAAQQVDTYFITGGVRAFGPGRINYHFGFSGPSLNIDTACSSSAAAMQVACTALWARDCDTAIVGGLSCMTNPDIFSGLSRGQFLSKKGPCATFDQEADGYCRGDGCASVIVKRLEDAEADGDRVLAVILGTATNHSADAISITHPHGPTQSILSRSILDEAGVDPVDVDYVEMHGTGTQAGDGTEMESVTSVFAPRGPRKRSADRPLYLGAVKANVGHGEAASGVTALIKVLMMLQKSAIPPHVGIKKGSVMNKGFPADLSDRNVNIAFHMTPFRRSDGKPRRVFVNNFSAAGGNTGLLLEDAPKTEPAVEDPRPVHVITVTAKSKSAMIRNAERLVEWVRNHPETPLSHVAYSMTARHIQHYWRMSVVASDLGEASRALMTRLKENFVPVQTEQPKVAFLFTGQGSHYAGLGKSLYQHHAVFRKVIDEFNQIALIHGFPSFIPLIDESEPDVTRLSPLVIQLGLACFEMALARLWASWGIKPSVVLGHSLGEYAALNAAGVLSVSDTIYLVGARAKLLQDNCTAGTHAMLATQGSVETIKEALGSQYQTVNVACMNGPRETVLSGEGALITEVNHHLTEAGFKCTQLKVPFAFHSNQVEPVLVDFERLARSVRFATPKVPVISPLLGELVTGDKFNAKYLSKHAREPVNFVGGLASAQKEGAIDESTVFIEIGPHPICAGMVKATFGATTIAVPTLRRQEETYKTISSSLCTLHTAGLNINFHEFHRDFARSVRLLDLPGYSFDEKNYWLQYEGDWCLTKNRVGSGAAVPRSIEAAKPKLSTTTVQKVIHEEVKGDVAIVEIESDLCQEQLRVCVSGHQVNGAPLCPSSLYADMAMTVCNYAYKLVRPDAENIVTNVAHMDVPKTLIFNDTAKSHVLRLKVIADVKLGSADLVFSTGEGAKKTEHAICKVYYGDREVWQSEFDRLTYLIKSRVEALMEAEKTGKASKIGRGLAYKLFCALVDYNHRYQGMEEVILDSSTCEATAKIRFQTTDKDGSYYFSPYHVDSLCHISGFIINGTDAVDSREQVYISHGWDSLRFTEIPQPHKEYRSYIRMQPIKGTKVMSGDVYIFDGDKIIGKTGDLKFQAIPRKVLNIMLPPRGAAASAMATAVPAKSSTPAPAKAAAVSKAPKRKETKIVTKANITKVNAKLSVTSEILDILAAEVGVSHDELADNIAFTDLGVDSLMSLTVSGRIREDLDLDLSSTAFVDYPTIGAFKGYLVQFEASGRKQSVESAGDSGDSSSHSDSDTPDLEFDSDVTTPLAESDTGSDKGEPSGSSSDSEGVRRIVRETIATEMGVDVDEILAAPDLANLGMDSLMSLSILGTLREKTGMDIPADLFVSNPSLKAVETALGINTPPKRAPAASEPTSKPPAVPAPNQAPAPAAPAPTTSSSNKVHPHIEPEEPSRPKPPRPGHIVDSYPHYKATSVILSGSHRTASKHLFMIPDGSGSATSYTEIADVGGDWVVWGLFSPFLKTPEHFHCGVYGMALKFIDEMKRRQPSGPYSLAGWSAGGVIAFEIINQLVKAGDAVDHLIIIDAPCPITIEALPKGLHAWFASIGLLGDGDSSKIPPWLLPHFAASVSALSNYTAEPIPREKCPKVLAIWCEDGVCHLPTDPRPEPYPKGHALFLLDNRTDFGPNRWDEYLDVQKMTMRHMPGNHFSMMHGDLARQLNGFLKEALL
ncbi:Type I Iterative Polyketide synthase (PKS) [Coniochaeta pulveracea]|uniref:Type I Iterative Polyketide synthase (PKS) n=1 Tax=Coniochaeta pulveracea TaxID=177199 RepID=A0A420YCR0_9PEZI|nr:Type I Iterative Polyketide synthase (PKS) [Coniochaeta pulveracea]